MVAAGAGWLSQDELAREIRRVPPWAGLHGALLPAAILFGLGTLVVAYFGVPTVWLSATTVALLLGHLWPGWSARESAAYWAPEERHLRFTVRSGGVVVETTRCVHLVSFRELDGWHRGAGGWLLQPRGRPRLWLPRPVFGDEQAGAVDEALGAIAVRPDRGGLRWLYVGGMILSVAATVLEGWLG